MIVNIEGIDYLLDLNDNTASAVECRSKLNDILIKNSVKLNGISYSVTSIYHYIFNGKQIKSIIIEEGIMKSFCSFPNMVELKYVKIPKSFKNVPKNIFENCSNIETVDCAKGAKLSIVNNIIKHSKSIKYIILDQADLFKNKQLSKYSFRYVIENSKLYDLEKIIKSLKRRNEFILYLLKMLDPLILSFLFDNKVCELNIVKDMLHDIEMDSECKSLFLTYINSCSYEEKKLAKNNENKKVDIELGLETGTLKDVKKEWKCSVEENKIYFNSYIGINKNIVIPGSIDGIKEYVFSSQIESDILNEIHFAPGCTSLELLSGSGDNETFAKCVNLKRIILPQTLNEFKVEYCMNNDIEFLSYNEFGLLENAVYIGDILVSFGNYQTTVFNIKDGIKKIQILKSHKYTKLETVTIPNTVELIGNHSFYRCTSLQSIVIPSSVREIGIYAFSDSGIEKIYLSNGLEVIDSCSFYGCHSLRSISLPNTIEYIGNSAFTSCNLLKDFIIPSKISFIGRGTFSGCKSIEKIFIPKNIVDIGSFAFASCSSLKSVNFEQGIEVDEMCRSVFGWCNSLENIELPNSVKKIGKSSFEGCSNLTKILIGDNVVYIGEDAFNNCNSLCEITIPNNVLEIESSAFRYCESLNDLILPENITCINESLFSNCTSLKSINIPKNVVSVGKNAFINCTSLTSINIPKTLRSVPKNALSNCSAIVTKYKI